MSQTLATVCKPAVDAQTPWLVGVRVLCSQRSTALEVAGRMLSQFGADVVFIDLDVRGAQANDPHEFDIVLVDRISSESDLLDVSRLGVDGYLQAVDNWASPVWVTASAFGLTGPGALLYASEVSLLAAAGILGHSRIADDLPPTIPAAPIGLRLVGTVMAVAALHGLHQHRTQEANVHVDLSAQGAVIATGLTLEMGHALANCPDEGGSGRYGAPTGMFSCLDGAVYVIVLEEHQWKGIQRVMAPALDHIHSMEQARSLALEVNAAVGAWTASRTQLAAESALQAAGVPCTAVNTVAQFADRVHHSGRTMEITGPHAALLPARLETGPPHRAVGEMSGFATLNGLRVLDAGHVLAVPLATAWLGAMGAEVAKLEDPNRLDVYRRRGPFANGIPGPNRSAYFNHINFCKTLLDLTTDADVNAANIATFDVVINNLSPHRARRLGVDPDSIALGSTAKFVLTSSGFGQDGDLANYRAYGTNIHAFAGLVAATRDSLGNMAGVGTPWADPLTSVAIAAWVLAWALNDDERADVALDLSMAEVLAAQMAELIDGDPTSRYELTAGIDFFVQTVASGDMVAVSLTTPAERADFERITAVDVATLVRRGGLLTGSTSQDVGKLEQQLQEAGIRVARVRTAADLAADETLIRNGLFRPVESPSVGVYLVTGLPWRFTNSPEAPLWAAPERPGERH